MSEAPPELHLAVPGQPELSFAGHTTRLWWLVHVSIHRLCCCVDEQAFTSVWYAAEVVHAISSQLQASLLAGK